MAGLVRAVKAGAYRPTSTSKVRAGGSPSTVGRPSGGNNTLDFMGDRLISAGGFSTLGTAGATSRGTSGMPSVIGTSTSGKPWDPASQGYGQTASSFGPYGGGGSVNTAGTDPNTNYLIDRIKQRTSGMGTLPQAMAMNASNAGAMAEGARNALTGNLARRGMLGSGSQDALGAEISNRAIQSATRENALAALQRERDVDSTLVGSAGIFAEPGRQALADRGLGIQQFAASNSANQAAANQALQAQLANAQLQTQQMQLISGMFSSAYR